MSTHATHGTTSPTFPPAPPPSPTAAYSRDIPTELTRRLQLLRAGGSPPQFPNKSADALTRTNEDVAMELVRRLKLLHDGPPQVSAKSIYALADEPTYTHYYSSTPDIDSLYHVQQPCSGRGSTSMASLVVETVSSKSAESAHSSRIAARGVEASRKANGGNITACNLPTCVEETVLDRWAQEPEENELAALSALPRSGSAAPLAPTSAQSEVGGAEFPRLTPNIKPSSRLPPPRDVDTAHTSHIVGLVPCTGNVSPSMESFDGGIWLVSEDISSTPVGRASAGAERVGGGEQQSASGVSARWLRLL
ncbi:hypothetical protein C7974DRAFT_418181 [Boeremia exigua]|uniref:uncharacterized protein n=1 Tax=Boeremia exigua TaxID=749465 RepID=UPI001E8EC550|nr:uncharacterized protein C7974DRAFT_418181 [Boeremia exigua]KAH6613091.1 hypothetical protein C7974DRAFT_418181 [Boeremia exigua]